MYSENVLVSICCITYNQASYLPDTLKGFESQEAEVSVEIIIYDDFSTDNTRHLLAEYKKKSKYPVHLILPEKNSYSKGERIFPKTFKIASGNYIALCEGDDYWTDSKKLQKQLDFLKDHPSCSFCFHKAKKFHQDKNEYGVIYPKKISKEILTPKDFFKIPTVPTASIVFRNKTDIRFITHSHGDFQLYCQLLSIGNAGFLNETMAVYRVHPKGVSSGYGSKEYLENRINELLKEKSIVSYSVKVRREIKKILVNHISYSNLKHSQKRRKNVRRKQDKSS